ncbi:MAG: sulfurtransferase TusA family protein [Rhizobiales bacterium]|nr:sulfurtransferase TusA family protein [Hyphomicrobiales bacterium]MDQ3558900.1 sulfurtransferase TusA family protein [Pseudomonadota bacterium]
MGETVVVDVRGLKCPLPVLKTAKRMAPHPAGTRFLVLTTDPMAAIDVPHFCGENGHHLRSKGEDGGEMQFEIEKG